MVGLLGSSGFAIYRHDPRVYVWAEKAFEIMHMISSKPPVQAANLRHGNTWFVGVDALPNTPDGAIGEVPLMGAWSDDVPALPLHRAQISIIYSGYPKQDAGESDANHRYRMNRSAAHVDGLLPVGPQKRRFAREYHAYILAIPLGKVAAAPTVVWQGSQTIMQRALRKAIGNADPSEVDITDAYQAAVREVFDRCPKLPLNITMGQAALLHPFLLHGTDRWNPEIDDPDGDGRMTAFFRPDLSDGRAWLDIEL